MIKLLITKFWPVLIPIVIYIIWLFVRKKKNKKKDNNEKRISESLYILVITVLLTTIACFIYMIAFTERAQEESYYPPKVEGDKVLPGYTE